MMTIRAIYENGQIRLLEDVELSEGQELQIKIVSKPKKEGKRIPNLHPNAFQMTDDFDDPLPDSFWLGQDDD
ncbi:MAG: antitoxin family protein [Chloroflexota bacterium]